MINNFVTVAVSKFCIVIARICDFEACSLQDLINSTYLRKCSFTLAKFYILYIYKGSSSGCSAVQISARNCVKLKTLKNCCNDNSVLYNLIVVFSKVLLNKKSLFARVI